MILVGLEAELGPWLGVVRRHGCTFDGVEIMGHATESMATSPGAAAGVDPSAMGLVALLGPAHGRIDGCCAVRRLMEGGWRDNGRLAPEWPADWSRERTLETTGGG